MDIMWTLLWIIGLCSVAGKMGSISEGNSYISDFEGYTEEDLVDNISVVPDSDLDSSDISKKCHLSRIILLPS